MGKECPECRLVEEEYTRAAAEELTHDALLLKLASLQVLLDQQSHEMGVASRRMEQAQSSRTKLSKEVKELKHQLVTERNFTDSYIRRLHESENKRRDAQALLERIQSDMLNDWKPFKVIEAGEFRNTKGEMEKFFYVVLQVPGFQTTEQFEGNLKECEEECNELNQRISASLSLHIQNQS